MSSTLPVQSASLSAPSVSLAPVRHPSGRPMVSSSSTSAITGRRFPDSTDTTSSITNMNPSSIMTATASITNSPPKQQVSSISAITSELSALRKEVQSSRVTAARTITSNNSTSTTSVSTTSVSSQRSETPSAVLNFAPSPTEDWVSSRSQILQILRSEDVAQARAEIEALKSKAEIVDARIDELARRVALLEAMNLGHRVNYPENPEESKKSKKDRDDGKESLHPRGAHSLSRRSSLDLKPLSLAEQQRQEMNFNLTYGGAKYVPMEVYTRLSVQFEHLQQALIAYDRKKFGHLGK